MNKDEKFLRNKDVKLEDFNKTLNITNIEDAKSKVSDIEVVGNGDMFKLLCKASSKRQNWMKSTKACQIDGLGCIVQVTTQQGENVAESITFVPDVMIVSDSNGGNQLIFDYNSWKSRNRDKA
jgi:hypothetical protein